MIFIPEILDIINFFLMDDINTLKNLKNVNRHYNKIKFKIMTTNNSNIDVLSKLFNISHLLLDNQYNLFSFPLELISLNISRYNVNINTEIMFLTKLQVLDCSYNRYIDCHVLKQLTNLTCLNIGAKIGREKLSGVKYLKKLVEIEDMYGLLDDETLLSLVHLRSLRANNKNINIKFLTNLTDLSLYNNPSMTDENLGRMTSLTKLDLHSCTTITDKSLSLLTGLTSLHLGLDMDVTDVSIYNLVRLKSLCIKNNTCITGISIQRLTDLRSLYSCSPIHIFDDELIKLTNLTNLIAYIPYITDTSLSHLTNLESLNIHANITDKSLSHLTRLKYIDCSL